MVRRSWISFLLACVLTAPGNPQALPFPLSVPQGYRIDLVSNQVRGARFIASAPNGDVVVALLSQGAVVALSPGAPVNTPPRIVVSGLYGPNAVVFRGADLYIASVGTVVRLKDYPNGRLENLVSDLPAGSGHLNRALALDPQGRIFVSSGSSCNVCQEQDARKATILRYEADGSRGAIFASGLRNASGLTFDDRGRLWAVVNQRHDLVPDHTDLPPEELDQIQEHGNYGWPYAYPIGDKRLPNPEFPNASVAGFLPTTLNLQAHSAPLQIAFDTDKHSFFVAYHGSWNRSPPTGYKVVSIKLVEGKAQPPQDFVTGWLTAQGRVLGRPVGVAITAAGDLLISDDTGYVFRVTKTKI